MLLHGDVPVLPCLSLTTTWNWPMDGFHAGPERQGTMVAFLPYQAFDVHEWSNTHI